MSQVTQLDKLRSELKHEAHPAKVLTLQKFFKTGPGEYAEGDLFLGITVPAQRKVANKFKELSLDELQQLLKSDYHEERLTALFILHHKFKTAKTQRTTFINFYLKNKKYINNWDLVDTSAEMLGEYIQEINDVSILDTLIQSNSLWDRRIAMIATFHFIKQKQPQLALQFAEVLLKDKEPLIQKASGWMLRELGKRCGEKYLIQFLDKHVNEMSTVMFSYATERLTLPKKKKYQKIRRDYRLTSNKELKNKHHSVI